MPPPGGGFDDVAHTLRASGFDASEDGTGRGTPLVPIAFHRAQDPISGEVSPCLGTTTDGMGVAYSVAIRGREDGAVAEMGGPVSNALRAANGGSSREHVLNGMAVRRLTPRECERLQGFPDDYTAIPKAKDGPRYMALGNSMAVPVIEWLGRRINAVEAALEAAREAA